MSTEEDREPKPITHDSVWIDLDKYEFKYVMDIALYNNLDHLIHHKKHQFGIWLRIKEKELSGIMSRMEGNGQFSVDLRNKLQEAGCNVFGW